MARGQRARDRDRSRRPGRRRPIAAGGRGGEGDGADDGSLWAAATSQRAARGGGRDDATTSAQGSTDWWVGVGGAEFDRTRSVPRAAGRRSSQRDLLLPHSGVGLTLSLTAVKLLHGLYLNYATAGADNGSSTRFYISMPGSSASISPLPLCDVCRYRAHRLTEVASSQAELTFVHPLVTGYLDPLMTSLHMAPSREDR